MDAPARRRIRIALWTAGISALLLWPGTLRWLNAQDAPATNSNQSQGGPQSSSPAPAPAEKPSGIQPPRDPVEAAAAQLLGEPPPRQPASTPTAPVVQPVRPRTAAEFFGLWVLTPAVAAIALSIVTRSVLPSLLLGVLVGAFMLAPFQPPTGPYGGSNTVVTGARLFAERFVLGVIIDRSHAMIIVFTLLLGFLIGLVRRNGGAEGIVRRVAGESRSRRRAGLTAWLGGVLMFFDDYASCLIVGPPLQPIFDRSKLSRAKLAYILNGMAAPVASLALIGTWVGTELGYIEAGLRNLSDAAPAFLSADGGQLPTAMSVLMHSLPYRFFPIFAIFMVFLIVFTGRDFGPMKQSERRLISRLEPDPLLSPAASRNAAPPRWWLGFVPLAILVLATVVLIFVTGWRSEATTELVRSGQAAGGGTWAQFSWLRKASEIAGHANANVSIFYGTILAAFIATVLTLAARAVSLKETFETGIEGMTRVLPALVILVLAWGLSGVLADLQLGSTLAARLQEGEFSARWLPLVVGAAAYFISFSTGSAWGTMGILCPLTVEITARLAGDLPVNEAMPLLYAAVGSVLGGAVFGNHCSPIADVTVLSTMSSGCPYEEHLWTQLPYVLLVGLAGLAFGDTFCGLYGQPWYYGIGLGAIFLALVVFAIGRRPVASFDLAHG